MRWELLVLIDSVSTVLYSTVHIFTVYLSWGDVGVESGCESGLSFKFLSSNVSTYVMYCVEVEGESAFIFNQDQPLTTRTHSSV
jgi:hypothetical protein